MDVVGKRGDKKLSVTLQMPIRELMETVETFKDVLEKGEEKDIFFTVNIPSVLDILTIED